MKKLFFLSLILAGFSSAASAQKLQKRTLQSAKKNVVARKKTAESIAIKQKADQAGTPLQKTNPDAALIDPRALSQQKH